MSLVGQIQLLLGLDPGCQTCFVVLVTSFPGQF